jgi:hypothetical protein
MALLGSAALAMWWKMAPAARSEFEHWHSHEHFPERLSIPGFLRATRWHAAGGSDDVFVMYELQSHDVLSSPAYAARLNAPTPWSTRMMPLHRNMVRSQCRVLASRGSGTAAHVLTVRFSAASPQTDALEQSLRAWIDSAHADPGIAGIHLLQHQTPQLAPTTEQHLRGGGDAAADRVLIVVGYDGACVADLAAGRLSADALLRQGAAPGAVTATFALAHSASPPDVR